MKWSVWRWVQGTGALCLQMLLRQPRRIRSARHSSRAWDLKYRRRDERAIRTLASMSCVNTLISVYHKLTAAATRWACWRLDVQTTSFSMPGPAGAYVRY